MDVKVVLLCIESAVLVLFLAGIVVSGEMAAKWHRAYDDLNYKVKKAAEEASREEAEKAPAEPEGYVQGVDRFLDNLTFDERTEFYKVFIQNNCCGLKYKEGENNSSFFSGVFINLSGVSYAVSDGLMHKICVEYDRLRGLPVTAENK